MFATLPGLRWSVSRYRARSTSPWLSSSFSSGSARASTRRTLPLALLPALQADRSRLRPPLQRSTLTRQRCNRCNNKHTRHRCNNKHTRHQRCNQYSRRCRRRPQRRQWHLQVASNFVPNAVPEAKEQSFARVVARLCDLQSTLFFSHV